MAGESAVQEIIVPDIHDTWSTYKRLANIIDDKTDRVYIIGDLKDHIDQKALASFLSPDFKTTQESIKELSERLNHLVKTHYGSDTNTFIQKAQAGQISQFEAKVLNEFNEAQKKVTGMLDEAGSKESAISYQRHNKFIEEIIKLHPHVKDKMFGVPGNHDTAFFRQYVTSVKWLTDNQALEDEGVIGALVSQELNEQFNGPNLRWVPTIDDDYKDLSKSPIYNQYKGVPIDLMVAHCGGHWGESRKYKGGLGITELGKEQGFVCYSGHDHDGIIYRDEETNVLVVRPGTGNIAKVYRKGKDVTKIELYAIPNLEDRRRSYAA